MRALFVAALAAAALAAAAPADAARPRLEIGIQDDPLFVRQPAQYGGRGVGGLISRERAYTAARRIEARSVRINVIWKWVAKTRAQDGWDWSYYDSAVDAALAHGVEPQLTLTGPAPGWATADGRPGARRPDPAMFGEFAAAAAERYRGRVPRYSIWNEPNWDTWLNPVRHAPGIYRDLYVAGYKAVKRVDPRAKVLIGELQPYAEKHSIAPIQFLRGVTCTTARWTSAKHCTGLRADGLALHPYQFTTAPNVPFGGPDDAPFGSLGNMTRALDRLAHRHALTTPTGHHLNLYLTEFGYLTKGSRALSASRRAAWLTQAYTLARRNPRVKELLQYQLVDGPARNPWHSGVMTRRGVPQAPFRALARLARKHH